MPKPPGSPVKFVRLALTAKQPKLACALYTPQALRRAYGGLPGCESAVRSGGSADSVKVQWVLRGEEHAGVVVVPRGGPSSGEKLRITLVHTAHGWRIDAIHSNVPVGP